MINDNKLGNEMTDKQSEFIIEEAKKDNLPTIIVGDFNLVPESKSIQLITEHFRNLPVEYNLKTTRPASSDKGNQVIDHIFVNDKIDVKEFKAIDSETSDHLPLIMDFDIK
ncbi:MAG: endonuclease/exonuclease/phosphatase family protein [Lactobacillus sp.]|jgi:endonuclease/exonuclease/phosphatase family metal-dependent hydrolase|nr:endonuclease/exonuclease/phosphatase family protein [Lactobacillus sp.]